MRFDVVTLFPELFAPHLTQGITRRAFGSEAVDVRLWPLRDFAEDTYRRVDDRPYGGGPGMVLLAGPLLRALAAIRAERPDQAAVLLVNPTHVVEERRVTLGLETPSRCEVMAGLHEGDLVIVGNRSRVHPGQSVAPRPVPSPAPATP